MKHNHFVWTDLSTFDMKQARKDYKQFFGWEFQGDKTYDFATINQSPVAAIFPMPKRLADINMPSFWMSYISVNDLDIAIAKGKKHDGVIVEIDAFSFDKDARVALIRDPSGAGFTLYEGPEIARYSESVGHVLKYYHHVTELKLIAPFYSDLFGWEFVKTTNTNWPVYDINDADGNFVAHVEEVPESVRGKFNYWIPCFGVESAASALALLYKINGDAFADLGAEQLVVSDRQGASFMVQTVQTGA